MTNSQSLMHAGRAPAGEGGGGGPRENCHSMRWPGWASDEEGAGTCYLVQQTRSVSVRMHAAVSLGQIRYASGALCVLFARTRTERGRERWTRKTDHSMLPPPSAEANLAAPCHYLAKTEQKVANHAIRREREKLVTMPGRRHACLGQPLLPSDHGPPFPCPMVNQ